MIPNRVTATLPTSDCAATTPKLCGNINVYSSQATNVLVDISGYYTAPSGTPAGAVFIPETAPVRVCDTRPGNPSQLSGPAAQCNGSANTGTTLRPGQQTMTVQIGSQFGVPLGTSAAALNVTAVSPSTNTVLTVYPDGSPPTASDLNPSAKGIEPNLVIATLTQAGSLTITNSAGTVDVVVDLTGWYLAVPAPPTGLTAVPGLSRVDLTWTAPTYAGASPITGSNVYEGLSAGGESSTPLTDCTLVTVLNCPATGLTSGTTYYFTVKAVNAIGASVATETSATPGPPLTWSAAGSAEPPVEEWNDIPRARPRTSCRGRRRERRRGAVPGRGVGRPHSHRPEHQPARDPGSGVLLVVELLRHGRSADADPVPLRRHHLVTRRDGPGHLSDHGGVVRGRWELLHARGYRWQHPDERPMEPPGLPEAAFPPTRPWRPFPA